MDILRAVRRRTTNYSKTLQSSTSWQHRVLTIHSTSPITWMSNRGKTTATPSNTSLPIMSKNFPNLSTTSPFSLRVSVKKARNSARPCNISSSQEQRCSTNSTTTERTWEPVTICRLTTTLASVNRRQNRAWSLGHSGGSLQYMEKLHVTPCSRYKTTHEGIRYTICPTST